MDLSQIAAGVKRKALELGFDLAGIAPADPSRYRDYFRRWLDDGQAGTMDYLHRRFDERTDPAAYLPGARSIVCVAINYHYPLEPVASDDPSPRGRIARYALGDDYHEMLKPRLYALADWLRAAVPEVRTRCSVDTAPVMEKELSARAGVGWIGKNTCVINERAGSWLLLGEVLTTLPLPADEPAIDRCGTCTRCIDACPTGAITAPYQLDARRCISYLTIEHKGDIASSLQQQLGDWLFGCDICQDVCPWNKRAPVTLEASFVPRFATGSASLAEVMDWQPPTYAARLRRSAMKRVKLPILQRNAQRMLDNTKPVPEK